MMRIDFTHKVVLITGATRGIGKQIADDCALLGAELILTGTKELEIRRMQELSQPASEGKRHYYCVDFTSEESTAAFMDALQSFERIDVCINNAGINRINYVDETLLSDWDDIINVNLKAPFMILRQVSKTMKKNGYGRIVNISSVFGLVSREKRSIYSCSKFGLRGLSVAASNELARYNVLVNTVSPGFVLTELTRSILSKEEIEEIKKSIPMGRFATAVDISRVVLFLTSELNTYVTGQNIIVDGGFVNV